MRALQEAEQRAMRAGLGHAVQIEPGIDLLPAPRELRSLAAADRRQRRRLAVLAMPASLRRRRLVAVMQRALARRAALSFRRVGRRLRQRGRLRNGLTCFATLSHSARSSSLSARLRRGGVGMSRHSSSTVRRFIDVVAEAADVRGGASNRGTGLTLGRGCRQRHRLCHRRPARLAWRTAAFVAAAGASSGLAPFGHPSADRPAETALRSSPTAARPARHLACPRATGSRLFGTSMTKRAPCFSRPATRPASAPAPK